MQLECIEHTNHYLSRYLVLVSVLNNYIVTNDLDVTITLKGVQWNRRLIPKTQELRIVAG